MVPPLPPELNGGGPRRQENHSLGSGFIISEDGYILTNAHVIADADEVTVRLTDKRQFKARIVGADRRTDVALLKVDAKGLPRVTVGNPDSLRVGEWVLAIGSPFGFDNSVTSGIVSAKGRSLPDENYVPFIQTDVPINPGNSGGPLFNMKGEVVGINSQIYSRTGGYMGLSFAIPIDVAMNVSTQLRANGKVSRGRIGIGIQEMNKELATSFGLKNTQGALVTSVEPASPAEKGGLQPGDVILKFDGKAVENSSDLPRMVGATQPGTTVRLDIWRQGKPQSLTVTLGEMPNEPVVSAGNEGAPLSANALGLAVNDLTAEQRKQLRIRGGVLVEGVQGAAARAGIRQGDVILAVNNTEVTGAAQFNKLVAQTGKQSVALLVRRGNASLYVAVQP